MSAAQRSAVVPMFGHGDGKAAADIARLNTHADELRRRRQALVRQALERRELAQQALDAANAAATRARAELQEATQQLREQIERGELFVLGDVGVEVNAHGGLTVRPVNVVSLL